MVLTATCEAHPKHHGNTEDYLLPSLILSCWSRKWSEQVRFQSLLLKGKSKLLYYFFAARAKESSTLTAGLESSLLVVVSGSLNFGNKPGKS